MPVRWTEDEDEAVRRFYPENGPEWGGWARHLNPCRSSRAIARRAAQLDVKLMRRRNGWTSAHDRLIVAALVQCCRETGRSPFAVIRHMEYLYRKAAGKLTRGGKKDV